MCKTLVILVSLYLVISASAEVATGVTQTQQRIWVVKHSDAFDRADVEDYRALNGRMRTLLTQAKLDHCDAYLIPSSEGPAILVLSAHPELISPSDIERKLFTLVNTELSKRLRARGLELNDGAKGESNEPIKAQ